MKRPYEVTESLNAKKEWLVFEVASIAGGVALSAFGESYADTVGAALIIGGSLLAAHDIYDILRPEEAEGQK